MIALHPAMYPSANIRLLMGYLTWKSENEGNLGFRIKALLDAVATEKTSSHRSEAGGKKTGRRALQKLAASPQWCCSNVAHKIGRILAGNPSFRDHWADIAGYAKLVADRCSE
jgi:hypothetical protein